MNNSEDAEMNKLITSYLAKKNGLGLSAAMALEAKVRAMTAEQRKVRKLQLIKQLNHMPANPENSATPRD